MRRAVGFLALAVALAVAAAACSSGPGPKLMGPTGDDGGEDGGIDGTGGTGGGSDGGIDGPGDPTDLATACGGTAPVTLDDWENCYQKRKCEWEVGCVSLDQFRDVADCVASGDAVQGGQLAEERRARKRAIAQGRASLDVAAFTQCLLRTGAGRCDTALFDPACLTRFTGTIADNQGCFTSIDCASLDAVCQTNCPDACCLGTCHRKFREGEACDDFASCEPGLRCALLKNIGFKCVNGNLGTPCHTDDVNSCDFGAFCDPTTLKCVPALAPGAACQRLGQCGGDELCVGLSITVSNPGHCTRISKPGDRCDGVGFCYGNLYCASNTCHSMPVLDQSCSASIPCAGANTVCNSGRCVLRSDVNVSCSGDTCLPGLFCTSELGDNPGVCAPRRADGLPCAAPSHCQSFLCSGDAAQPGTCLPWKNTCP
jgi:hypothetical protein